MAVIEEMPSQAYRAEAVAEAGMGADSTPPTAIHSSRNGTDLEKAENSEHVSPLSSTIGAEANEEKDVAAPPEQRNKGKTALIMSALCVRSPKSFNVDMLANIQPRSLYSSLPSIL